MLSRIAVPVPTTGEADYDNTASKSKSSKETSYVSGILKQGRKDDQIRGVGLHYSSTSLRWCSGTVLWLIVLCAMGLVAVLWSVSLRLPLERPWAADTLLMPTTKNKTQLVLKPAENHSTTTSSTPPTPPKRSRQKEVSRTQKSGTNGKTAYRAYDVCHMPASNATPPENHLVNETETARLKKVFERFQKVRDVQEGDTEEHTAQVRFVTSASDLSYTFLFPYLLSATVAGIPIDVLGVGDDDLRKVPFLKWVYLEEFIRLEGLKDEDVVMLTDGDVLFTGRDVLPMMEEFLATTARSAVEMDVVKVRTHQMRAPFLLSTEENCYMEYVLSGDECRKRFEYVEQLRSVWVESHNEMEQSGTRTVEKGSSHRFIRWEMERNTNYNRNTRVHPNSGSAVTRVWALKEVIGAARLFEKSHFTPAHHGQVWRCDQSMMGEMLLELMRWELKEQKVLAPKRDPLETRTTPTPSELVRSGPHRLTPGVMGLDYRQEFTLSMYEIQRGYLNKAKLTGLNVRQVLEAAFEAVQKNFTREVWDEKAGVHRRAFTAPLAEKSPTGIPLAPLQITGDDSSRWAADKVRLQGYPVFATETRSTLPMDEHSNASTPALDVSVPLAIEKLPLMYHFNGVSKLVGGKAIILFEKVMPWMFPMFVEWDGAKHSVVTASNVPEGTLQVERLQSLVVNSPPLAMWEMKQPRGTKQEGKTPFEVDDHHLTSEKKFIELLNVCDALLQKT